MSTLSKSSSFFRVALALTVALGCGAVVMNAQTTDEATTTTAATINTASSSYSTSADQTTAAPAANTNLALNVKPFNFLNAMQYGSGSRRGAPRYRGGNTNPDGSNKWIFLCRRWLMTLPVGNTRHRGLLHAELGVSRAVFGGRQWSKKFALPLEFNYDNFGMTALTLVNQETSSTLYHNGHHLLLRSRVAPLRQLSNMPMALMG